MCSSISNVCCGTSTWYRNFYFRYQPDHTCINRTVVSWRKRRSDAAKTRKEKRSFGGKRENTSRPLCILLSPSPESQSTTDSHRLSQPSVCVQLSPSSSHSLVRIAFAFLASSLLQYHIDISFVFTAWGACLVFTCLVSTFLFFSFLRFFRASDCIVFCFAFVWILFFYFFISLNCT